MELMEALRTRRSIRRYATRPVERELLERLIEAAILAPSASNTQPWAFGVIEGIEALRECSNRAKPLFLTQIDEGLASERFRARMSDPGFNIFHDAPALVCIYSKPVEGNHGRTDCAMAAQNLMLAARDLELGSCWIGFARPLFNSPEFKREQSVPEDYVAVAQLVVGYPEEPLPVATTRKPPELLFWKQKPADRE